MGGGELDAAGALQELCGRVLMSMYSKRGGLDQRKPPNQRSGFALSPRFNSAFDEYVVCANIVLKGSR